MTGDAGRAWWRRRLALALAIVVAIVAIAPVSNVAADAVSAKAGPGVGALRASDLVAAGTVDEALAAIEQLAETDPAMAESVPDGYAEEIGFMAGARDVRVSGPVVGFVVDGASEAVFGELCSHMRRRGWTAVPIGDMTGATFVKDSGQCTWALAACTQVGDATSVVFQFT